MRSTGSGRRAGSVTRLLAATLAFQLVGFPPVTVFAQDQALCGLFGTCTPATGTTLLGLPQGTLGVRTVEPWDRVVKGSAATAWEPLEAEARAFLAALHGVPNDDRLAHAAVDEMRALILTRLLDLADREAKGQTLTAVESSAVQALRDAIIARRVDAAQKAINEYYRWANSLCGYHVPPGFSFDEYAPGPGCGLNDLVLTPPRPPTKGQFTAYGAALANLDFVPADAAAATARLHENLAALGSIGGAALAAGITAIVALAVPGVAAAFAALAGSTVAAGATVILGGASIGATAAFDGAVIAGGAAAISGIGATVGASIVGFAILAEAVTILGAIEFAEDAQILPELQRSVIEGQRQPSITAMLQDSTQSANLMIAFMAQTLPDYATERLAAGPVPPSAPVPGRPVFDVNGVQKPVLATLDSDGLFRETFMSGGWFVTRTRKSIFEPFGPWHWALKIPYQNAQLIKSALGIQPGGFLDIDDSGSLTPRLASKVLSLQMRILGADLPIGTVTFAGNHSPLLNATASAKPLVNTPVTFTAGASDPDAGDTFTVGWYFQDYGFSVSNPDFAACDLRPTPTDSAAAKCPWVAVADPSGAGVTRTFTQAGSYGVLAVAKDSHGALSSARFFVNVNGAPSLTLTPPSSTAINEGDSVTIAGTLDYPRLPNGLYATISSLVIDWGDGTTTTRDYPCFFPTAELVNGVLVPVFPPSGSAFCLNIPGGGGFISSSGIPVFSASLTTGISGGPVGPWDFQFSHTYAFGPTTAVPGNPTIKVYATTKDNLSTPITTYNVTVNNVVPVLSLDGVCPLASVPFCPPSLVSGPDIREVPVGSPMTLGAVIADAAGAAHAVKVFWGDGSSSFLPAGCTDAGCPAPAAVQLVPDRLSSVVSLTHTYSAPGSYPIQMMATDGGPGGFVTANGTATAYGVKVDGPTSVNAGVPAAYTLTPTLPNSFTLASVTPSCDGGNVTDSTPTSFTCVFADVATTTTRAANVTSSIAGRSIGTGLSVNVAPRLPVISGPTSVVAGQSATYTYQPSTFSTLIDVPGCSGQVTAATPGSITCTFADSQAPYVGTVVVTQIDALSLGGFASTTTTFDVNVGPDLDPPVLSVPSGPVVPSTTNAGAVVSYQVTAVDAVSGPATPSCSPASGTLFPIGSTTVSCTAADWKGNLATGGFAVVVLDKTPPTLSLPAPIAVDATSSAGAIVTFSAKASDVAPAAPGVTCLPTSGARFPIGTTTVTCRASDAAGNQASGQFPVKVAGASAEIQALQSYIAGLTIDVRAKNALLEVLKIAAASVAANRRSACAELEVVAALAKAAAKIKLTKLTAAQAAQIVSAIGRIRMVVGC